MNGQTLTHQAAENRRYQSAFDLYLQEIRPEVNDRINEVINRGMFDDHILPLVRRGKRLRAGVLLLVHDTLADNPEKTRPQALDLACAVELAHAASLIVDDMIDEDDERRGLPTVHIARGVKIAMLDSIGLLSLPYILIAPYEGEFVSMLAEAQQKMTFGVIHEIFDIPKSPGLADYETISTMKTGCLFGLASEWGFLAAMAHGTSKIYRGIGDTASPHDRILRGSWRDYGVRVGRCMQMADDIVDLQKVREGSSKPGSEILFRETVCSEEFLTGRERCMLENLPIRTLRDAGTVPDRLLQVLREEGEKVSRTMMRIESIRSLVGFPFTSPRYEMLRDLGYSIANIILDENRMEKPAPATTG